MSKGIPYRVAGLPLEARVFHGLFQQVVHLGKLPQQLASSVHVLPSSMAWLPGLPPSLPKHLFFFLQYTQAATAFSSKGNIGFLDIAFLRRLFRLFLQSLGYKG